MLHAVGAGLSLDLKLGYRMLAKHPGMSVVATLALAFALWVGAVAFELTTLLLKPAIPLPEGERIVQLRNWDVAASDPEPRVLHDVAVWRASVPSLEHLGVWRDVTRNLAGHANDDARPVLVADVTAEAFSVAGTQPLLGRTLTAADGQPGAPPVVVIGHDLWRGQFAAAADVLGRVVRLDGIPATVVGVMPEEFAFPVAHEAWMPLPATALDAAPRDGVPVQVFARLAPGATLAQARIELEAVGRRMSGQHPDTHARLQPQLVRYGHPFAGEPGGLVAMLSIQGFALLLLLLVACNVALLLFARTTSREEELLVRSALGASRTRLGAQLVAEALVLGAIAAALGLGAAWFTLEDVAPRYLQVNLGQLPFWMVPGLSLRTVGAMVVLTLLAACIAGLLPALKVTRAFGIGSRLKGASAGGGGLHFGGVWTLVIVLQVAVAVAFPATVFVEQREAMRIRDYAVGFAADEYLAVRLQRNAVVAATSAPAQRDAAFAGTVDSVRRRLLAEPGVRGVSLVDRLPRSFHPEWRMELDQADSDAPAPLSEAARAALAEVAVAHVDAEWFNLLGAAPVSGRVFHAGDLDPGARTAVVDEGFVERVLDGRNPLGMRIRRALPATGAGDATPGPWLEIVGVVPPLGMDYLTHHHRAAGLYLPLQPAGTAGAWLVAHVPGDPLALLPRVRDIAIGVDPALRVAEAMRLDQIADDLLWILAVWMRASLVLSGVALLLSLAGIYAVLSFTVARRTREIGIRVAMGASGARIAAAIFRRPLLQVGLGVALGSVLIGLAAMALTEAVLTPTQLALLVGHGVAMLAVCLLACVVPTRRALRVHPSEALRSE